MNTANFDIPDNILNIAKKLKSAGFEVYLVGGCVRNLIMSMDVKDWDFTTDAKPDEIEKLFDHTVCENDYGTVKIILDDVCENFEKSIEITPYRKEVGYSDMRRPDKVIFGCSLKEDLSRRDFTINALAYNPVTKDLIDNYNGISDLHLGIIRTVGDPMERFNEDALRIMRAVRIATQLEGKIEKNTLEAIKKKSKTIENIAIERVRDELVKILMSKKPAKGILLLAQTELLKHIVPELLNGIGIEQNQAHKYDVFEHNIRTLEHSGVKNFRLEIRLAAMLHDVSKPETREWSKEKEDYTFYIHEVVGAKVAKKVLKRLKFSNNIIDVVTLLVRWHMFFSDTEKISLSGVRRMVARVGENHIWDLIDLRVCDRIGTGRPKEQPYRLRKYISLVEEILREPITPGVLEVDGNILMKHLNINPGKKIGNILDVLLGEVLDDPEKNKKDALLKKSEKLNKLEIEELNKLGERGRLKKFEEDKMQIEEIRNKYGVR